MLVMKEINEIMDKYANLISVIVTVYNADKYLEKCLLSVCAQTYSNLEIIIVDDGSVDSSAEICDCFARKDNRIKVIHKNNEGVVLARKIGLCASTGNYISVIDSDDYLEEGMLLELYNACENNNCQVSMCGRYEETNEYSIPVLHGIDSGKYDKDDLISKVYPRMISNEGFFSWGIFPSMWDKLFKREVIFDYIMSVDNRIPMGNDAAVVYPCLLSVNSIYIIGECLYHYRQNQQSISKHISWNQKLQDGFKLLYSSVNDSLEQKVNTFDCRNQWYRYVTFLMMSKFDCVYYDIDRYDYLFPYKDVKRGSKVALYGMGTYGKRLYNFINRTNICDIVMAFDREYTSLIDIGYKVDNPINITKYEFDYIIISVTYAKTRNAIFDYLKDKCKQNKIILFDESILNTIDNKEVLGIDN